MPTQLNPPASALPVVPVANVADATGNFVVPGNTNMAIRINNGSASSITVTLDDPTTPQPEGAAAINPDAVITIAAGAARYIVLDKTRRARFINPANGRVSWTYSAATTVTVEVVAVSP
jgi:hypothetical protein